MICRVDLVRTYVSEERSTSIIRVTRYVYLRSVRRFIVASVVSSSLILVILMMDVANVVSSSLILILMMDVLRSSETSVLKEPHGLSSQKTAFFIVTAVKTSNLI
jgi:hypothetical protein